MDQSDPEIPYLERGLILNTSWRPSKTTCSRIDADEIALSMNRAAPPLRDQQPPSPPPGKPPTVMRQKRDLVNDLMALHAWLNTPSPPKPDRPTPPAAPAIKKQKIKPFDLQDIPDAMDRIGWPMSAKLQRKWFAGELNYATTDEGAVKGINQNGEPFPPSMIDTTMFKMDWILQFKRAKEKYDELINEKMFNQAAIRALKEQFSMLNSSPYYVYPWDLCNGDIQRWHREYQFQRVPVDSDNLTKFAMFVKGVAWENGLFMDDLYGALGAFSFYATLGVHQFSAANGKGELTINSVHVYMRDVFTFHDRSDERGTQYLGHWKKDGFIVVPAATIAGELTKNDWPNFTVAKGGVVSEKTVYYPVRNKDYRAWQIRHGRGVDLILYSDRREVEFHPPKVIIFNL